MLSDGAIVQRSDNMTQQEINEYRNTVRAMTTHARRQALTANEAVAHALRGKWFKSPADKERLTQADARAAIIRSETGW